MDELRELEEGYDELTEAAEISYKDLKRSDHGSETLGSKKERLNLLERRVEELEKSLVLTNKNFENHKKYVKELLHERIKDQGSPNLEQELKSLKTMVEGVSNVNQEIKTKTPKFLRELESKVDKLEAEITEMKELVETSERSRPVIME